MSGKPIKKKYGRLTVLSETDKRTKDRGRIYLCRCDCGKVLEVSRCSLVTGNTQSCGCLRLDRIRECGKANRQLNEYDLDKGICIATNGAEILFDREDYEKIKDYTWFINDQGYALAVAFGKHIRMHRLIMSAKANEEVDHINGIRSDNRKCNLRKCTHARNIQNGKKRAHNTSGHTGVYWDKSRNKWIASINANGEYHHLGRFDTFEEAVKVREAAEDKYFGEYAYKNRPILENSTSEKEDL